MRNHLDQLRENIDNPPIQWMKLSGIHAEIIEQGHIRLVLPVKGMHLNHVNTVYAGSMFAFAEMAGGVLFQATYGFESYVPIVKKASIRYVKPATSDLSCELSLSAEEKEEKIAPIAERGRGDFMLEIPMKDKDGEVVAIADINYYIIPVPGK